MKIDIHVHTNRYSECATADPDEMVQGAKKAGLDAMVISEHNHLWSQAELNNLQSRHPEVKLFRGIEVSITWEEHILVLGVPDPKVFYPLMSPHELMAVVNEYKGVAILAHPYRWSSRVKPSILEAGFHAVESYSTSIRKYMQGQVKNLAQDFNVPTLAASDGHNPQALGAYYIQLAEPVQDENQLAQIIKSRQFTTVTKAQKIDPWNQDIRRRLKQLSWLRSQGLNLTQALEYSGLSRNLLYPLRRNLDIEFPKEESK